MLCDKNENFINFEDRILMVNIDAQLIRKL